MYIRICLHTHICIYISKNDGKVAQPRNTQLRHFLLGHHCPVQQLHNLQACAHLICIYIYVYTYIYLYIYICKCICISTLKSGVKVAQPRNIQLKHFVLAHHCSVLNSTLSYIYMIYIYIYIYIYRSIYIYLHLSISIYLSIYLSIFLSFFLSVYLSIYLSIYLSNIYMYLSGIYIYIYIYKYEPAEQDYDTYI